MITMIAQIWPTAVLTKIEYTEKMLEALAALTAKAEPLSVGNWKTRLRMYDPAAGS